VGANGSPRRGASHPTNPHPLSAGPLGGKPRGSIWEGVPRGKKKGAGRSKPFFAGLPSAGQSRGPNTFSQQPVGLKARACKYEGAGRRYSGPARRGGWPGPQPRATTRAAGEREYSGLEQEGTRAEGGGGTGEFGGSREKNQNNMSDKAKGGQKTRGQRGKGKKPNWGRHGRPTRGSWGGGGGGRGGETPFFHGPPRPFPLPPPFPPVPSGARVGGGFWGFPPLPFGPPWVHTHTGPPPPRGATCQTVCATHHHTPTCRHLWCHRLISGCGGTPCSRATMARGIWLGRGKGGRPPKTCLRNNFSSAPQHPPILTGPPGGSGVGTASPLVSKASRVFSPNLLGQDPVHFIIPLPPCLGEPPPWGGEQGSSGGPKNFPSALGAPTGTQGLSPFTNSRTDATPDTPRSHHINFFRPASSYNSGIRGFFRSPPQPGGISWFPRAFPIRQPGLGDRGGTDQPTLRGGGYSLPPSGRSFRLSQLRRGPPRGPFSLFFFPHFFPHPNSGGTGGVLGAGFLPAGDPGGLLAGANPTSFS